MNNFYAICPFCKKSIFAEDNDGKYVCSVCGQDLDFVYLQENNLIIDVASATEEYTRAQQLFANTDFKGAGIHFKKVLCYDSNHYLAEYYSVLCDIYENEDSPEYNVPQNIVRALINSIDKLILCRTSVKGRVEFLSAVLNDTYIILSSHMNRVYENYEKTEMWDILRDKCLNLAACIKELTDIDKEQLMTYDENISKSLVNIANVAICACQKIVQARMISDTKLDLPTDYQYEKAKALFNHLQYYAVLLDSKYDSSNCKPDYTANLLFNESVTAKLNAYNSENKSLQKKYLSTPGVAFDAFKTSALIAVKYSYHTCFKGLFIPKNDSARTALINDSVKFCFELLIPRVSLGREKKIVIDIKSLSQAKDVGVYLNEFLCDLGEYNIKLALEYLNRFFRQIYDTVKFHYSNVSNSYIKQIDKLKETQNAEYRYYKNFLHQVIRSCALALKQVISYDANNSSERQKVLKFGKQITDEFLLINDYKIEEIEQSARYSDVLDIFNAFDNNLEEYSSKR